MLGNIFPYGQVEFHIKEIYFHVLSSSKQGLLPAKVNLLGNIPRTLVKGEMCQGVV